MIELIPKTYLENLDAGSIFGRSAPLHVDLGCGEGSFLCELARQNPDKNFLGIDKLTGRVTKACRKAATLPNVRVLNAESSYAVRYLLAKASVETFYLLFPDPWPKRRHHRRRILTNDFLDSIHHALTENGVFRIATDQLDYFQQISRLIGDHLGFVMVNGQVADLPITKFESRFREQGAPIYRLALRKVSPVVQARADQPSESNSSRTAPVSS
jgi:tRNA (guanine-N7-)-methyltransferase